MANRRDAFSAYMYSGRCLSAGVYVEPKSLHLSPWILFTSQHKYCSWSYPHCSSGSCTCLRKSHSGETTLLPQWHVKDPGHPAKRTGGRLQLNTHAPYVCGFAWSDMVHGCMVYTECAETAAVSCGTSHASAVSTPLRWIFKNALIKSRITCERSESARERRIALYKSNHHHHHRRDINITEGT